MLERKPNAWWWIGPDFLRRNARDASGSEPACTVEEPDTSPQRSCPLVDRGALVGVFPIDSWTRSRTCLPITLHWSGRSKQTSALLDSGAEESFLDAGAATRLGILLVEVSHPLGANSLNSQIIGRINIATVPLRLLISGNHQETISLLMTPPFSCHPGPPVDGHLQPRDGLEEAWDPGLESCLLDKMSA